MFCLDYTKAAQRLERCLIKAWRKHFPPNDYVEKSEAVKKQELACIEKLGALDKKIHEEIAKEEDDDEAEESSSSSSGNFTEEEESPEYAIRKQRRTGGRKVERRIPAQPIPFTNWSPSPNQNMNVGTLMFSGTSTGTTVVNVLNKSPQTFQFLNRYQTGKNSGPQTPLMIQSGGRPMISSGGAGGMQPDHDFGQTSNPSYNRMMDLETSTRTANRTVAKQRSPTGNQWSPSTNQTPVQAGISFRPLRAQTGAASLVSVQNPRIFVAGQRISIPTGSGRMQQMSGTAVSGSGLPAGSQLAYITRPSGAGSSINLVSSAPIETFGDRPTIAMNDKHDAKLLPSGEIIVVERIPSRSGPMKEVEKGRLMPGEKLYERLAEKFRAVGYKIPSAGATNPSQAATAGPQAGSPTTNSSARPICSVAPTLKAQTLGGGISAAVPRSPSVSMVSASGSAPSYIIVNSGANTGSQATVQLGTLVNIGNNRMVVVPIQNQSGGQAMLVQPQIVVNAPNQRQMIVHAAGSAGGAASPQGLVVRSMQAVPSASTTTVVVGQTPTIAGDNQGRNEGSGAGAADDLVRIHV